jgi:tRNA modification GTPase
MAAGLGSDTIFAVASGAGRAAVAVFRVSGAGSGAVLDGLCRSRPAARRAVVRTLRDRSGVVIDRALVLWLPGPGSFTGEDCLELHVHGGRAVIEAMSAVLVDHGLRPAEPGEFTRRAFLNGRMDLLEAEALADLIDAETTAQRQQALRQLEGGLGEVLAGWRERLVLVLAQQEALIDFPDEDLPDEVEADLLAAVVGLRDAMRGHLDDNRRGERLREGLTIAVLGPPNAGKSTLINVLAQRDVAIVADLPGTTRDVLEARVEIGGVPVTLLDTAGLRESADPVEAEGVRRALVRAGEADLLLVAAAPGEAALSDLPAHPRVLRVATKADLGPGDAAADMAVSARTGAGMEVLREALAAHVRALTQAAGPAPLTRARHRAALQEAADSLDRALAAPHPELRGEDLRLALRALGRLTGQVGVEDILDSVFLQFCIGK